MLSYPQVWCSMSPAIGKWHEGLSLDTIHALWRPSAILLQVESDLSQNKVLDYFFAHQGIVFFTW